MFQLRCPARRLGRESPLAPRFLEIGRLRMFQLRCPARRLGRESPLAPRFLDFDLTTTEGRAFASFSQFLGALIELGLAASAKISTLLSITSGLGAGGFEKNC